MERLVNPEAGRFLLDEAAEGEAHTQQAEKKADHNACLRERKSDDPEHVLNRVIEPSTINDAKKTIKKY